MNSSNVTAAQLETTTCPLCQSAKARVAYPQFDPYAVVQCECKFYYLSPRLTEAAMIAEYSKDDYFEGAAGGYDSYLEQASALQATFGRFIQTLNQRHIGGQSLLEIGCGYGYLLDAAKSDFGIRVGTDFSARAIAQAQSSGARVYRGGVAALPADERFDCVVATHVIEHVYDPDGFLAQLKSRLNPGGTIVLATPHMGSWWRFAMGHRWPSFKLPEHILYFDYRSLLALMQQAGFTNLKPFPYPHAFPLSLIASKFNLTVPPAWHEVNFWIPGTTVAISGTLPDHPSP
jgi:2-polyprenyl-3-methyl-5-hydroxy-6-metoxy-1,4-benzoquinol methylase